MQVRRLTISDVDRVVELGVRMADESPVFSGVGVNRDFVHRQLTAATVNISMVILVAERAGEIVGFMAGYIVGSFFNPAHRVACDFALYVVPEARGSTAALRLVSAFEAAAIEAQVQEIRLGVTVGIDDERAGRFYERLGYRPGGTLYTKARR